MVSYKILIKGTQCVTLRFLETCQCDELSSRLKELKVDLADRNAKITALELQFEADNFPFKKKASDLEKSLDQAKNKVGSNCLKG